MTRRKAHKGLELLENGHKPAIEHRITKAYMGQLLQEEWGKGCISGAHWFRDAARWYRMNFAFNNPLNVGSIHSELILIEEHKDELAECLKDRQLIFFGVGTGDTEMAMVDICLERWDYAEVIAIDANAKFLEDFAHSMRAKMKEDKRDRVYYLGLHDLFERLQPDDLSRQNTTFHKRILICLGNTIGNYSSLTKAFQLIIQHMGVQDSILVSYQTLTHLDVVYKKYLNNMLLRQLIESSVAHHMTGAIEWRVDRTKGRIEAYCGNVNVFRSAKLSSHLVEQTIGRLGLTTEKAFIDKQDNIILHLFQREGYRNA